MIRSAEGSFRLLATVTLATAVVEAVRPTASYRAIELGAGAMQIGLIAGAFAVLAVVVAIPVGRAIDRVGERPFLIAGAVVLVVACAVGLFFRAFVALFVMQALLGVGQVCVAVAGQTLVGNTAGKLRDIRFARLAVAIAGGQFLGPLVAGSLIDADTSWFPGGGGSLAALTASASLGVIAVVVASTVRSSGHGDAGRRADQGLRGASVAQVVRISGMPRAMYLGIVGLTAVDLIVAYLPVLGEQRGIAPSVVGLLLATRGAMSIVSRLTIGPALRRLGRRGLMTWAMGLSAAAMVGMAFPAPLWLLFVYLGIVGLAIGASQPMTVAWVSSLAAAGERGAVLAVRLTGNRLSQITVPVVLGGVATAFGAGSIFLASGAALTLGWRLVRTANLDGQGH